MKKTIIAILLRLLLICAAGCKTNIVHCDSCGTEIRTKDSKITEEWILYCNECNEELFEGDPLLDPTP